MRRRSLAGPLLLLLIGGIFLWNNLRPELPLIDTLGQYWPFLLIGWGLIRLIEVLARPEPGRAPSFTGGEVALVVLVCIIGMGMFEARRHGMRFNARGLDMFGQQYDYPIPAVNLQAAGIKRIVFENPRGNVRVTGGDSTEVVIAGRKLIRAYNRVDADHADKATSVEAVTQGDRLLIRTNQDKSAANLKISHDLEVTAPRGVIIEARNTAGDFDVSEINGDVELASDRADVRLSRLGGNARVELGRSDVVRVFDVKGTLQLSGRGSDLELENIAGQVTINGSYSGTLDFKNLAKPLHFESRSTELRVESLPGRISMDLGEFNGRNLVGPVKLVTKSRDIKIEDFTQSLELETDRGDIELQPGKMPLAKIEARSKTGRIDLALPDKAAFQLEATAEHGEAVNDYGPSISRERDGRTATLKGKAGNGPTIHLTTDRGTVTVRKAGVPSTSGTPAAPSSGKSLADSEVKL